MRTLKEVQRAIQRFVIRDDDASGDAGLAQAPFAVAARLRVYRHHFFLSLTEALAAVYPVVSRIVDEHFFVWLAHEFLRANPPRDPRLSQYGGSFALFIERFAACKGLPYLVDVARLEWALHESLHAPDEAPLMPGALRSLGDPRSLRLPFLQSVRYLDSPWPVARIWTWHRVQSEGVSPLVLERRPTHLEIRRMADAVGFREIDPASYSLRSTLAGGGTLSDAASAANWIDPDFNLALALGELIADGVLADANVKASSCLQDDHVVEELAADGADQTLGERALPGERGAVRGSAMRMPFTRRRNSAP